MSDHKAFHGTDHKARFGTDHKWFGAGEGLLLLPGTSDIAFTWEVNFHLIDITDNTLVSTTGGEVQFHERMFHVLIWLLGSPAGRGQADVSSLKTFPFSAGSPDTLNDLFSSNGFTLTGSSPSNLNFSSGWPAVSWVGAPSSLPVVDTGSSMELRGQTGFSLLTSGSLTGAFTYDPQLNTAEASPRQGVEDWIIAYFLADGSITYGNAIDRRILLRHKIVLSA